MWHRCLCFSMSLFLSRLNLKGMFKILLLWPCLFCHQFYCASFAANYANVISLRTVAGLHRQWLAAMMLTPGLLFQKPTYHRMQTVQNCGPSDLGIMLLYRLVGLLVIHFTLTMFLYIRSLQPAYFTVLQLRTQWSASVIIMPGATPTVSRCKTIEKDCPSYSQFLQNFLVKFWPLANYCCMLYS